MALGTGSSLMINFKLGGIVLPGWQCVTWVAGSVTWVAVCYLGGRECYIVVVALAGGAAAGRGSGFRPGSGDADVVVVGGEFDFLVGQVRGLDRNAQAPVLAHRAALHPGND
jgi:hypothetical protein